MTGLPSALVAVGAFALAGVALLVPAVVTPPALVIAAVTVAVMVVTVADLGRGHLVAMADAPLNPNPCGSCGTPEGCCGDPCCRRCTH